MTKDCQKKYLQDLRCRFGKFSEDTSKSISIMSIDKNCKIRNLQVLDGYLESIEYYTSFENEVTYAHKFSFTRTDTDQITIQIDIGGNSFSVTDDGDEKTFVREFYKEIENNSQSPELRADFSSDILYVYSYDSSLDFSTSTSVTITQGTDQDNEVGTDNLKDNLEEILDLWNCLSEDQLCKIINGAYDLMPESC